MKEQFNNLDELLRSGLEGFEQQPSPGVWKRIATMLFFTGKGFYLMLAALLIISTGAVYYFGFTDKSISNPVNKELLSTPETGLNDEPSISQIQNFTESANPALASETTVNSSYQSIDQNDDVKNTNQKGKAKQQEITNPGNVVDDLSQEKILFASMAKIDNYPGIKRLYVESNDISFNLNYQSDIIFPYLLYTPEKLELRSDFGNLKIRFEDDYAKRINLLFGLHTTPEFIFNTNDSKPSEPVWNFDLTAYYFKNDWFIQAGAGLGVAKDNGTFDINYAQYDSVGYYDAVKSFSIDESTGAPVFNIQQEALWDTVEYHQNETTTNQFTYLRFPLYVGLRIHEIKRFSVYLKAGGIYSILLNSKKEQLKYANDRATWITITNETPNRISTNFQVSAGIALHYQLSNTFALSAEPMYNYYFNPVYRKDQESSAWSLGLRAGIIFKIKSK